MSKSENIQTNRTEDGGLPPRQRHMVLGIMMAGTTAACISQSMMIAALPTIMQEFLVGAGLAQLITTAYIFTLGLFSAMSAYLVSKLDARRLFFIAMVGFIVGCCASLFATNYPVLLASRLVQAIGAGILLPLIQVVALSIYPKSQYGKAMGIVGIIIGFAPAIGPAISGFIVDAWGWRAVFVALGVVSAAVTLLAIPFLPNVMRKPATHQRFDALSAVLFSFGAICLLVATACIEQSGWGVVAAASIALGAVLLFTFARRQLRIPNPLLKLSCFANRQFTVGLALVLLRQSVVYGGFHHGSAVRARCARRLGGGFWLGHSARRGAARLFEPYNGSLARFARAVAAACRGLRVAAGRNARVRRVRC